MCWPYHPSLPHGGPSHLSGLIEVDFPLHSSIEDSPRDLCLVFSSNSLVREVVAKTFEGVDEGVRRSEDLMLRAEALQ